MRENDILRILSKWAHRRVFSQMVYPGYLETLNKETDAGPLLAFRSNLMRFDSTVMFCKVAIIALYRLFSLVEQVVIGPARESPGGKSCSIILAQTNLAVPAVALAFIERRRNRDALSLIKRRVSLQTEIFRQ